MILHQHTTRNATTEERGSADCLTGVFARVRDYLSLRAGKVAGEQVGARKPGGTVFPF